MECPKVHRYDLPLYGLISLNFQFQMLSILSCANGTLTTFDMQRMLGNIETKEPLPLLAWTSLHRTLKAYLRIAHFNEQIVFVHDAIRTVSLL